VTRKGVKPILLSGSPVHPKDNVPNKSKRPAFPERRVLVLGRDPRQIF